MSKGLFLGAFLCGLVQLSEANGSVGNLNPRPFTNVRQDGYVLTLWQGTYTDAQLDQIIEKIKASGAKHLSVAHFGCQTDLHSSDVGACELMSYPTNLRAVERALSLGLDASILPLMASQKWEWRGYFVPTDVNQWFVNYRKWILQIAADAERLKLKEFVVGSEFSQLQKHPQQWRSLIQEVKGVFSGPVIFTVNWDSLDLGFWDAVDAIGVSAYFSLSKIANPSQEVLDQAWAKHKQTLLNASRRYKRPIHITEVGYTNSSAAANSPWHTPPGSVRDDQLQARCFEAFRRNWTQETQLVRTNVWAVAGVENTQEISPDPIGRQAEQILRMFFSRSPSK